MTNVIKYSIPYNGDLELTKWAIESGQVYEVYFAGPSNRDYTSLEKDSLHNSEVEIAALMNLCVENGISRNLLINKSILYFDNVKDILHSIKRLEQYGGVTSVTISDPTIAPYIAKVFPNIIIQSSVYAHIDTANKIREAWKMGMKSFCLGVSVNRNGPELEKIRDLKRHYPELTIKLLANHGCFQNCFYARVHEDWLVLRDLNSNLLKEKYIFGNMIGKEERCFFKVKDLADEIKRPFIRPEDIGYYEENGLADYVKVCYRMDKTPFLKEKMKVYFDRSYDGNLWEIISSDEQHFYLVCENKKFPEDFLKKVLYCGYMCESCNYCGKTAKKVFESRQVHKHRRV